MVRHNSHLRQGMTLIETLVALGLLSVLIGLSAPLLRLAARSPGQDGEFQVVAAFDRSLQSEATAGVTLKITPAGLQFTHGETVQRLE